jgi:superfamily II DNA or RNA helicase
MIKEAVAEDRPIFFVHGDVGVDEREEVRRITENESDAIIVASYGTFSTGINIKNLHNIIFAAPTKSKIRSLQSIGRVLRLGDNKDKAVLYDIADPLPPKPQPPGLPWPGVPYPNPAPDDWVKLSLE